MSKRQHKQDENIYSSAIILKLEQQYCSSCSAAVISPCLASSRGFGERLVSRIYNGGRQVIYTATMGAMLANNMALPAYAASTTVSAEQTSTGLVADSGDMIAVYGVTSDTSIKSGGSQFIYDGGKDYNAHISGGRQTIASGGSARGVHISAGSQYIDYNATAESTFISGGSQIVEGIAYHTNILSGGHQQVDAWGLANSTVISAHGSQIVNSVGSASDTIVLSAGSQIISYGGKVNDTTINSGGYQIINYGGSANITTINGGEQKIHSGGVAISTSINNRGYQNIFDNGLAKETNINSHGHQKISSDGSAISTIINSSGTQYISNGGTAISTIINSFGEQLIYSGGTANSTTINSGGGQLLYGYGTANETIVNGSGYQYIYGSCAKAINTTILSGGLQEIGSGGSAIDTTINSGGTQYVYNNCLASNTSIFGGTQFVYGSANDTTIYNEGELKLYSNANINGLTASGGSITVYGRNVWQGNISLTDANLTIDTRILGSRTMVEIENLTANNTVFDMGVDLENQTADQLHITGNYTGDAKLKLNNVAARTNETTGDGIKLVDFDSSATVNGTFALLGDQWDEGGYIYKLFQNESDPDYYLRSTGLRTDLFKTMLNIPVMNVVIAQTGMNSLQKRLGDLRAMNNTDAKQGVWVRSYYKDMSVNDLIKTDMSLFGVEAGYDWLFRAEEPTKLYAGVLVGFVKANSIKTKNYNGNYNKGEGESPSVGVYATLTNENGWFVDLAARNFWTKLDMKNYSTLGTELAYKPSRNVFTTSIEGGKSINRELARNRFIRIEPKVEVGYMNAAGDEASVSNTTDKVKYDAANYINAKAAILLSYNVVRSNGLLIEPLLELAYRYEFNGKNTISYDGVSADSNLRGGTAEVNAGLNMQLTDNLYWYGVGSYEASNKVKGWGIHAGIRYAFGGNKTKKQSNQFQKDTVKEEEYITTVDIAKQESQLQEENLIILSNTPELANFAFASKEISLDKSKMDALMEDIQANPDAIILVEGHTDNIGSEEYNKKLSLARANAVAKELAKYNYPNEIRIQGAGYSKPIASNNTEEGRAQNRRVDIVLVKDDVKDDNNND